MVYVFLTVFLLIGLYCIFKGIGIRCKLDPLQEDYHEEKKKSNNLIIGGLLIIAIGIFRCWRLMVRFPW